MEQAKFAIDGTITFFYYDDLERASRFYEGVLGLEPVIDVDFAKVYRIHDNAHVGLVDSERGYLKACKDKPVMLTLLSENIDVWYEYLKTFGVKVEQPPKTADYLNMKTMLLRDPEGYLIEILQWLTKPYGKK